MLKIGSFRSINSFVPSVPRIPLYKLKIGFESYVVPKAPNHPQRQLLSKIATNEGHGENSSYHPLSNPNGVIQMDLAENQAIARFMEKVRGGRVKFDPDQVVMSGGAPAAKESIAFCLADPRDAFLVPTPYYPGFDRDFRWRIEVQLLSVHCESSNHFVITEAALEAAYERAIEAGIRVKGMLITNPSNPLGTTMDKKTLQRVLNFTDERKIHLVCDEVYAGTVFGQFKFTSIAEVLEESPNSNKALVHIMYSLSKDLGLLGFQVGIVYSYNDAVVCSGPKMCHNILLLRMR